MRDEPRLKILVLSATPSDTSRIAVSEEHREILERLRASGDGRIETVFAPEVRPHEFARALMEHRPDVVHFSGHGDGDGELLLTDDEGRAAAAPVALLARVFELLARDVPVRVVVLNACFSDALAAALVRSVDCVIGCAAPLRDEVAIAFSGAFYEAIAYGRDVRTAVELAKVSVELSIASPGALPALRVREGVDASALRLVEVEGETATAGAAAEGAVDARFDPGFERVDLRAVGLPRETPQDDPEFMILCAREGALWAHGSNWNQRGCTVCFDGVTWRMSACDEVFRAMWCASAAEAWAVNDRGVWHATPEWTLLEGSPTNLECVHGSGPDDVWFCGTGGLFRWDGARLTTVERPAGRWLHGVWASSPRDVWLLEGTNVLKRFDGDAWTRLALPPPEVGARGAFNKLQGVGPSDVYLSAHNYQTMNDLLRFDGASWRVVSAPRLDAGISSISGTSPDDLWVGANDQLWRFDGATWKRAEVTRPGGLVTVCARAPGDVWISSQLVDLRRTRRR